MRGRILDIGGKRFNPRGEFRPPHEQVELWEYINTDPDTQPDCLGSAEDIPLSDASMDGFLLCEVLEHLYNPEKALKEAYRVLLPHGKGWITMPFLYQVHADPDDYQRWTDKKLQKVLEEIGFSVVLIKPMGSVGAVIHDLLHSALNRAPNRHSFFIRFGFLLLKLTRPLFGWLERGFKSRSNWITTGWAVKVSKEP